MLIFGEKTNYKSKTIVTQSAI